MSATNKKYGEYVHSYCTLKSTQDDRIIVQFIDSGIFISFRRWLRSQFMIYERHPQTQLFYRSRADRRAEEIRHLMNYPRMIHAFSLVNLYWEFFMFWVFLYSGIIYSLNAVFLFSPFASSLSIFGFIGNTIFVIDFFHLFLVGYYDSERSKTVLKPAHVARKYLATFLIIDLIALIPWFLNILEYLGALKNSHKGIVGTLKLVGIVRLFRMKRWLEALDLLKDYKNYSSYVFKSLRSIYIYVIILFSMYSLVFIIMTYIDIASSSLSILERYFNVTLILMVVSHGRHSLESTTFNVVVVIFLCAGIILQLFLYTQILQVWNKFAQARNKNDLIVEHFKQYMSHKGISKHMRERIWIFIKFKYDKMFYNETQINYLLSESLRKEIMTNVAEKILKRSPIFQKMNLRILSKVISKLKMHVFLPDDVIIQSGTSPACMYFIYYGTVAVYNEEWKELRHLEDGFHFGEIALLYNEVSPLTYVCVTPTEVFKLKREHFYDVLQQHAKMKVQILSESQERFLSRLNLNEF